MDVEELKNRLEFSLRAVQEAGAITLGYFGSPLLAREAKSDSTPVTEADRRAELKLRERIREQYPDDGLLGEELGEHPGASGARWILDPIDGTQSFVRGVPLYGTLLGLEVAGTVVLGVVYLPALGEWVFAAQGLGAWWVPSQQAIRNSESGTPNPKPQYPNADWLTIRLANLPIRGRAVVPAKVSKVDQLRDALLLTTSASLFHQAGRPALFERLRQAAGVDRGWSDCYGHILVATGRAEVMVDPVMHPWDCAALKPILEEAGGTFTDLAGRSTISGGSALSTNGRLFADLMRIISPP